MKNHWLKKETKMNDRKILELIFFGKQPKDVEYKPFKYQIKQRVSVNVESGKLTGTIEDRYSTNDGFNWYTVELDKIWQSYDKFTFAEFRLEPDWEGYNIIPEYIVSRKKWFEHNYSITKFSDTKVTLDRDTFQPQQALDLQINVKFDAQHDGHLWGPEWKKDCDKRLIEEIIADLRQQVEAFIVKVNPFSVHC